MGLILAGIGFSTWMGLSAVAGFTAPAPAPWLGEAWDTSAYFWAGLPVMTLAVAAASYLRPRRAWRWPAWMVAGHQGAVVIAGIGMQSLVSLMILSLVCAALFGALFAVPAAIGSRASLRLSQRA